MTAVVERVGYQAAHRGPRYAVLVVAANPLTRETVVRTLRALGLPEVEVCASAAEARARLSRGPRDLCIVDANLPDATGLGLLAELRAIGATPGFLVTATPDPYSVRAAVASGVRACLVANVPADAGRTAIASSAVVPASLPGLPRPRGGAVDSLSARELQVLQLVADGQSNKDVGNALHLSALTVKSHLARVARKLGTGDRAEMVIIAMRAGLIA